MSASTQPFYSPKPFQLMQVCPTTAIACGFSINPLLLILLDHPHIKSHRLAATTMFRRQHPYTHRSHPNTNLHGHHHQLVKISLRRHLGTVTSLHHHQHMDLSSDHHRQSTNMVLPIHLHVMTIHHHYHR